MWLAYVVSHICYNARACASTCVRAQVMFLKSGRLALRGSAHEKHRRPRRTRRRQFPLIAMYSKLCPTEPAPHWGAQAPGG